jgi:hypothetical protein
MKISGKNLKNKVDIRYDELKEKFNLGINLAVKNMIEKSKKLDEKIAISKDGKVLVINAKDI